MIDLVPSRQDCCRLEAIHELANLRRDLGLEPVKDRIVGSLGIWRNRSICNVDLFLDKVYVGTEDFLSKECSFLMQTDRWIFGGSNKKPCKSSGLQSGALVVSLLRLSRSLCPW